MSQPTILIGIGSSGLYVLEQVQNFYYENLGKNKPNHVEYLYLETNVDNKPSSTALKNEIKRIYLSLADMKVMVKELKGKHEDSMPWLPPEDVIMEAGMGAGGLPVVGRVSLWGSNTDGNNFSNVVQAIKDMHSRLSGPGALSGSNSSPAVFITGSLTGGTGSGVFIDLAYIIRSIIHEIKDVFSLLLLPPKPIQMSGNEIIYSNTYGSLKALAHYNIGKNEFTLPNNPHKKFKDAPFELTQFISQSYNDGTPPLQTLGGLYKTAGLYLFLNIVGLKTKRFERLVDAAGNMQIGKYGTFGLSGIQYPKSQIQQYLALTLGSRLLNRWVDRENYYQSGTPIKIDSFKITNEIDKAFGDNLESAFEKMNASSGLNIKEEAKKVVNTISKGIEKNPRDYLLRMFSVDNPSGFYTFLNTRVQQSVDDIINAISEMIIDSFNKYESLFYIRKQLDTLADIIKQTLDYWKTLGITNNVQAWESSLSYKLTWMLEKRYQYLGEGNNILEDRILTVIEQLKMHLLFQSLINIGKNIKKEDQPLRTKTFADAVELPTLHQINAIVREIEVALGKRDEENSKGFIDFSQRKSSIKSDVEDKSIPIHRIFPSGSFDSEVSTSLERYKKEAGANYLSKDILVGDIGLWDYLTDKSEKLRIKLYQDIISKFRDEIDRQDVVKDYEVSKFVKNEIQIARNYASKSVSFLLPIHNKILERSVNIPKIVIGADKGIIENVIDHLREENFQEFEKKGDHMLVIPELKNLMVFYIEQGNYNPIKDIDYIPDIEAMEVSYPEKMGISKEKWFGLRNPYLNTHKDNWTTSG